ncbi:lipopolysaccharide biosynthesis protein [Alsobacter soli]|uniref:Lipopolysaccharide biosynthesis protein n=1 Tax=Alsobacter soli TaxID=2109933 RepID=A0A2T1HUC3_9HYPH|nr:exopolysaccharide transport family protein [Alsobacter soli]PSC05273.1 lipopolysaccharide biosynthesis protein [Alsobacter soli]
MAYAGPGQAAGGDLDAGQIWRALKRRSAWIVLPVMIACGGSAFFVTTATPRYTADARVLLQPGDNYYTRPGSTPERDSQIQIDEREAASQVLVISSRDLAKRAVDRLGLQGNPEFDRSASLFGAATNLLASLGLVRANDSERLIDRFVERVTAFPVGQSRVIAIEFTSQDPDLAARGANTVADIYLEMQEEAKQRIARSASSWLNGAIEPLRQKVADAEAKVEAFRAQAGIIIATNNATLQQQQLAELSTQLNQVRAAQADAQAKAKLLREALASGRTLDISEVANNELVRKLVADRTTAKAQLALESRSLLPGHPRIKELQAQLADIDAQITAAASKAVRTLENDARIAAGRVDALAAALEATKQQSIAAGEKEVELRALEREAKSQREQLEAMMTRYREASARESKEATPPDARIVQRADPPVFPSFPKKLPTIIIATLATFLVTTVGVVTAELLSGRAFTAPAAPAPAAEPLGRAVARADEDLGWQPKPRRNREAKWEPDPEPVPPSAAPVESAFARAVAAAEAADRDDLVAPKAALAGEASASAVACQQVQVSDLAREVELAAHAASPFRCVFVPTAGASARDAALTVGRSLSRTRRVVLVDGDATSQARAGAGFAELVAGQASFVQVIHRDPASRLHLVSAGALDASALVDQAQGLELALGALGQTYDGVLVAGPYPRDGAPSRDALEAMLGNAELAVIVAGPGGAPAEVDELARQFSHSGLRTAWLSWWQEKGVAA